MPPADVLAKIRASIAADPATFGRLLKVKSLWSHFGQFADEARLVRPPKGYALDTPHIEFIKQKSFIVWTDAPLAGLEAKGLASQVAAGFKRALPLVNWLRGALQ